MIARTRTPAAVLVFLALFSLPTSSVADHVNWSTDVESSLRSANESGRLVLMKFTAGWCGPCKKMEKETFSQPEVAALVNQEFVPVLLDADKNQALMKHLKITGIPALLVVSPEMVILNRMTGFQTKEELFPKLQGDLSKFASSHQPAPVATASISNTVQPQPGQAVARDATSMPDPFGTVSMTQAASSQLPLQQQQRSPVVHELPAFEGFCLPSVQESRSLVSGTPEFKLKYHGKMLYFQNAAQAEKFKANPELYFPMNDGTCTVTLVETGEAVEGKLEYAAMFRGRLWFASTPENMQKFVGSPTAYANALEAR